MFVHTAAGAADVRSISRQGDLRSSGPGGRRSPRAGPGRPGHLPVRLGRTSAERNRALMPPGADLPDGPSRGIRSRDPICYRASAVRTAAHLGLAQSGTNWHISGRNGVVRADRRRHKTSPDGLDEMPPGTTKPLVRRYVERSHQGLRSSTPNGIRTRAATLRGWCPRPLDDGGWCSPKGAGAL